MPSRRYYIAVMPVAHINGKMAPVADKVHNTSDPSEIEQTGFWYGYRLAKRPEWSRYGIRKIARDLNTKPYTPSETTNRQLFTSSLQAVNTHKQIAQDWALMLEEFDTQRLYISPIGFAVAECRKNAGAWPARWTH